MGEIYQNSKLKREAKDHQLPKLCYLLASVHKQLMGKCKGEDQTHLGIVIKSLTKNEVVRVHLDYFIKIMSNFQIPIKLMTHVENISAIFQVILFLGITLLDIDITRRTRLVKDSPASLSSLDYVKQQKEDSLN